MLLGVVAATFFLAVLTRSMAFVALQLLADIALAGYVYLLVQYKQRTQEQRSKVRYLGAGYRGTAPSMNPQYVPAARRVQRAAAGTAPADGVELAERV